MGTNISLNFDPQQIQNRYASRYWSPLVVVLGFLICVDYFFDASTHYGVDLEGMTNLCTGDSGGPMYFQPQEDDPWVLVGVNSFVFSIVDSEVPCLGGGAGSVRVDQHLDWLQAEVPDLQIWLYEAEQEELEEGEPEEDSEEDPDSIEPDTAAPIEKERVSGCHTVSAQEESWCWFICGMILFRRRRFF